MSETADLSRFVTAQVAAGTYDRALSELQSGSKRTHWMWFVFPQIAGLGMSSTAQRYAVSGLAEARAYLDHPVLGARLRECCEVLTRHSERSAQQIFGEVDALKLRSSTTLFLRADPCDDLFQQVLDRFFDGVPDPRTDQLIAS